MNTLILFICVILLTIWSAVLSFLLLRFYSYYQRLSKNSQGDSFHEILNNLLKKEHDNEILLESISAHCDKLEKEGALHIQKIGLLRFNPFKDTGGDQSFILVLVDGQDSGVVISSLHTRTGTRWYSKRVEKGKGIEYELSDEETKALKDATIVK